MQKEWFATTELAGAAGLPSTIQGINQKAKRELWKMRKRQGVQGKAVEYHIDSLPEEARNSLLFKDIAAPYLLAHQEPFAVWVTVYHQLTAVEREKVISLIIRHGVSGLMALPSLHEESKREAPPL